MSIGNIFLDENIFLDAKDKVSGKSIFLTLREILQELALSEVTVISSSPYSFRTGIRDSQLFEWIFSEPELAGLDPSDVRDISRLLDRCVDDGAEIDGSPELIWLTDETPADSEACERIWRQPIESELPAIILFSRPRVLEILTIGERNQHDTRAVFHLTNASQLVTFFRSTLDTCRHRDQAFADVSMRAFPRIAFAPKLKPTELGVDLDAHMKTVVAHLSFLHDTYCDVGEAAHWDLPRIMRMAKAYGIDLSDESANTKANDGAMRQRKVEVFVEGKWQTYVCSMHTKIEPTRGRIHFCVERSTAGHRIVVGLFVPHLDT